MCKASSGVLRAAVVGLALIAAGFASKEAVGQGAGLPAPSLGATPLGEARPVAAWVDFCQNYPSECTLDRSEPTRIRLTPAAWSSIVTVNRRVNATIRAVTDMEHWGRPDRWDLAEDGSADCEDFQLLKRRMLAQAGLPRRAMRMTVVIDEKGEGHAVLAVLTDRGDLILDNKTNAVTAWHETGYTFIKRESQDSMAWTSLGGVTSPLVTANR